MPSFWSRILRAITAARSAWAAPGVPQLPKPVGLPAAFKPGPARPPAFKKQGDAWPLGAPDQYHLYSFDMPHYLINGVTPYAAPPECGRDLIVRRARQLFPARNGASRAERDKARGLICIMAPTHVRLHFLWVKEALNDQLVHWRSGPSQFYPHDATFELAHIGAEPVLIVYHIDAAKPVDRLPDIIPDPNKPTERLTRRIHRRYVVTRLLLPAPHFTFHHTYTLTSSLKSAIRTLQVGAE